MIESITGIGRINVGNLRRMENKSQVISKNFSKPLKYVCLTHNDLDACGCVAVLEETLKPVKYFYTNYADLHEKIFELTEFCKENRISNVIIADVSLSQCRDSLIQLQRDLKNISPNSDFKIFDHHLYDDNFWHGVTAEIHIDKSRCASKILFDYFNTSNSLNFMSDFIRTVNLFDIYLKDEPDFVNSLILNELFFGFVNKKSENILLYTKEAKKNNFNVSTLLGDFKFTYKDEFETLKNTLKSEKRYIRSNKGVKTTVILSWDLFPLFTYFEMKSGQDVVIGVKYGIFKIRVKEGVFSENALSKIRKKLCGDSNYGHSLAFTYKVDVPNKDAVIAELIRISDTFNAYKE